MVTLRLTASQSVSLGVEPHLGLMTRYLLLLRVCLFYMLLGLASAVFLGSESLGTRVHILLSQIWNFPFRRLLRLAKSVCLVLYLLGVPNRGHRVEHLISLLSRKRPFHCCANKRLPSCCSTTDCPKWSSRIHILTSCYRYSGLTCHIIQKVWLQPYIPCCRYRRRLQI
jgi:hypothetical protein